MNGSIAAVLRRGCVGAIFGVALAGFFGQAASANRPKSAGNRRGDMNLGILERGERQPRR